LGPVAPSLPIVWQLAHLAMNIALPSCALIFEKEKTKKVTRSNILVGVKYLYGIIEAIRSKECG
jgi:hypothetical protein